MSSEFNTEAAEIARRDNCTQSRKQKQKIHSRDKLREVQENTIVRSERNPEVIQTVMQDDRGSSGKRHKTKTYLRKR